jgi:hypothetical protein
LFRKRRCWPTLAHEEDIGAPAAGGRRVEVDQLAIHLPYETFGE